MMANIYDADQGNTMVTSTASLHTVYVETMVTLYDLNAYVIIIEPFERHSMSTMQT